MAEVTLSSRNQIIIPREARDALGLKPGDKILVVALGQTLILWRKPNSYSAAIRGLSLKPYPKDYVKKERQSWR